MPALTRAENAELFAEMHALSPATPDRAATLGRAAIRDRIIEGNIPFATARTTYFIRTRGLRDLPYRDYQSTAYLALIEAVDRFDPALGNAFSTYAASYIWGYLMRHQSAPRGPIHVPAHHIEAIPLYRRRRDGAAPDADGQWRTGMEEAERAYRPFSRIPLGAAAKPAEDDPAADARREAAARVVGSVLATFAEADAAILRDLYGLGGGMPLMLKDVASRHGVTFSRAQHRRQQFFKRLKRLKPAALTLALTA